jgi:N-acetylglutamate synthase-like GNAT family acetyltransferase
MLTSLDVLPDSPKELVSSSIKHVPCLRSYHASDRRAVLHLYHYGLLAGLPDPHDPAIDVDHIEQVYLKRPQDHFWVAQADHDVIASIAISEDDRQVGHVRRLRVDAAWKTWHSGEVAVALIEKAAHHAREHDCLKLVLHTPVNDEWAIALLHQQGFGFARIRRLSEKRSLEFYLNIYAQPKTSGGRADALLSFR